MDNLNEYFLIDKLVIENNNAIIFDLFNYDSSNKKLLLIYEKGMNLSPEKVNTILTYNEIYAHLTYKITYYNLYQNTVGQKQIPKDMVGFYNKVSQKISELYESPESLENINKSTEMVTNIINIITKDDFKVSSFVTILTYDYHTHTHSLNVCVYALCLGKFIGLEKEDLLNLGISSLLHDLGKSKIDNSIINKNGKLTDTEFVEVKKHPHYGWLIAQKIGISNKDILAGIRYHHEKVDGTGYPKGLKGEDIPLCAKIISICDAFDAISTKRTYKDSISSFGALLLMKKEMSNSFDIHLVNSFIQMLKG